MPEAELRREGEAERMTKKVFTAIQPKHGDRVLHCAHIMEDAESGHFFALDFSPETGEPKGVEATRPDGSKIMPKWIVVCDACLRESRGNPALAITGDAEWLGNEPAIKVDVQ